MRFTNRDAVTRSEVVLGLSVLGVFVMSYLTWLHFSPTTSSVCDFSANFSCDIVNKSAFSEIMGIPVSAMGLVFFLFVLLLPHIKEVRKPYFLISGFTLLTLPLAASLTAVELFYLGTICIFCEFSKILMLGILALSMEETNSRHERITWNQAGALLAAGSVAALANYALTV